MDNIIKGFGILFKSIMKCRFTRYHLAGIFLLLIVQRNSEIEPSEYIKEIYFKVRFAPTPTKLLTWPIRMALCFLLALPNVPDFPLGLMLCDQYIFPFIFILEIMSCLLLGLHVTNYCSRHGSKCYYSDDNMILEEFEEFRSIFTDALLQAFIAIHLIYTMWLIKSIMHIIQFVIREIYKWFVRHIMPKVIPVCRVIVLMFVFNLQDAVIPILCIYLACKIFMDYWLMPLMDRPFSFPNEANGNDDTNNRPNNDNDDNSSEMSDEFEDIHEPTDEIVAA